PRIPHRSHSTRHSTRATRTHGVARKLSGSSDGRWKVLHRATDGEDGSTRQNVILRFTEESPSRDPAFRCNDGNNASDFASRLHHFSAQETGSVRRHNKECSRRISEEARRSGGDAWRVLHASLDRGHAQPGKWPSQHAVSADLAGRR